MKEHLRRLAGKRHYLMPDPDVDTEEAFNAHIDRFRVVLENLKFAEVTTPEDTDQRDAPAKGSDRKKRGGKKRTRSVDLSGFDSRSDVRSDDD